MPLAGPNERVDWMFTTELKLNNQRKQNFYIWKKGIKTWFTSLE